jgi:hypothetical protein
MDPVNIKARQLRWKLEDELLPETGIFDGACDRGVSVIRSSDDTELFLYWCNLEWIKPCDNELWSMEFDTREKSYLTRIGARYEGEGDLWEAFDGRSKTHVCDIVLPEGTKVVPNRDANEYRDFIATLPTGEKIMFHRESRWGGWITGIINRKGDLVMGHYPHDDSSCALY